MGESGHRALRLVSKAAGGPPTAAAPRCGRLAAVDFQQFDLPIRRAVSRVARRLRLPATDAEDLVSDVWLRVLGNSRVLDRFRGAASLETYFCAIAHNLALDGRAKLLGKWRPTAAAKRHGALAIRLERLIVRDQVPPAMAVDILHREHSSNTQRQLHALAGSMRRKAPRRHVGTECIAQRPSTDPSPYEHLVVGEARKGIARANHALAAAFAGLPSGDRHLLFLRYGEGHSVAEIAERLALSAKPLYRRFTRLLRTLRRNLVEAGVGPELFKEASNCGPHPFAPVLAMAATRDDAQVCA